MFTKRNQSAQPQSPCGLAFDHRNGQIVIAEYATNGGFDIYRAVIGERRSVNLDCEPPSPRETPTPTRLPFPSARTPKKKTSSEQSSKEVRATNRTYSLSRAPRTLGSLSPRLKHWP